MMGKYLRACLRRLWPKTLFAQLTLIMVTGTLAIQLLSSSIWFDVRFAQVLEAPLRLMASRSADLVRQGMLQRGVADVRLEPVQRADC